MRLAPTMLTAVVLVTASCTSDARSPGTTTTAAAGTTVQVVSAAPNNTSDEAVQCVHTDPAKMPISVHRALSCPDGTAVAVWGIVTRSADGSTMLCDDGTGTNCLKVDGGAVIASPGSVGGKVFFTGTVSKGVLTAPRSPLLEHP